MALSDKTLEYFKYIEEIKHKINSDNEDYLLNQLYSFLTDVSLEYYDGSKMDKLFGFLLDETIECEKKITSYITDVSVSKRNDSFISNIVALARKKIELYHSIALSNINSIDNISLAGECEESSKIVKDICNELGLSSFLINIEPGYDRDLALFHGDGYHYFNIVLYNGDYYLIDVTYKQFFMKRQCILERINVPFFCGVLPGTFMKMDDKRMEVANEVLKKGYIKLDEETLKAYLDGFTMSYRNGLYYQDHDYSGGYAIDQYIEFLEGRRNMGYYESMEGLGYLKRPIKKTNK